MPAMVKNKGKLAEQPTPPVNIKTKKASIWIRPYSLPVEIGRRAFRYLSPPRIPTLKDMLRFVIDLLGVIILLGSLWILLSETLMSSDIEMNSSKIPVPQTCLNIQRCPPKGSTAIGVALKPTSGVSPTITFVPSPTPRQEQSPTPAAAKFFCKYEWLAK
jgi:hypothetical protein